MGAAAPPELTDSYVEARESRAACHGISEDCQAIALLPRGDMVEVLREELNAWSACDLRCLASYYKAKNWRVATCSEKTHLVEEVLPALPWATSVENLRQHRCMALSKDVVGSFAMGNKCRKLKAAS